jgi:hypothetical protein
MVRSRAPFHARVVKGLVAICLLAQVAHAEPRDLFVVEAPFAVGVVHGFGFAAHPTVGGHLAVSEDFAWLHIGGGAEWTLILDYPCTMPQVWLTAAPELRTERGSAAIYLGPTLRAYKLYGPHATLAAELGARWLMLHSRASSRRRASTVGFYLRGTAPLLGDGWTATVCVAVGPPL